MSVEQMPDERLAHFYENIRQQVEADRAYKHQFMANPTVRQYADKLRGAAFSMACSAKLIAEALLNALPILARVSSSRTVHFHPVGFAV
jgi:hypothetical protein